MLHTLTINNKPNMIFVVVGFAVVVLQPTQMKFKQWQEQQQQQQQTVQVWK